MPTKRLMTLTVLLGLMGAACSSASASGQGTHAIGDTTPPLEVEAAGSLVAFDACETFLDHVIDQALDLVGPYGLDGMGWPGFDLLRANEDAAQAPALGGSTAFSTTNIQVAGVDEPDMVKTDGKRIVLISEGQLVVVDITGSEPVETGRLDIHDLAAQSLFLHGDRVLVFGSVWNHRPIPLSEPDVGFAPTLGSPTIRIVEVDISGEPTLTRTMSIDGSYLSGRMVGGTVRLVMTSSPVGFEWSFPSGTGLRAERKAIEENRDIIRESTEENWIPYYVIADGDGDIVDEGILFDCDRARHPDDFSGLDMLSLLTIDMNDGLTVADATGVLASGSTIYSSADSLYVATQNWDTWRWLETGDINERPDGPETEIHKFDISDPRATEYVASGSVDGYLLNQFAMDEHEGMLRVASTTTPNWWGSGVESESRVSVLRELGGRLIRIGLVDGLGETEQIYSVRFMGDVAYVVTFRQTDPLYTIDLTDPRAPKVEGELKIPGYSAYLHPIGEGLVMGVGRDATDEGRVLGTQVSVFDVSDLTDPRRVDTFTLGEGTSSQVEFDHHAFLFWEDLALIPIQQWWWDDKGDSAQMGALGLRVGDGGELSEIATVSHARGGDHEWDWRAQILRSIVVDDAVYTISPLGIMKSDLHDLSELAWLGL